MATKVRRKKVKKSYSRDEAFAYAKRNYEAPPGWRFTANGLVIDHQKKS